MHIQNMSIPYMSDFTINGFFTNFATTLFLMFQCNGHVEMNTFCVVWRAPG